MFRPEKPTTGFAEKHDPVIRLERAHDGVRPLERVDVPTPMMTGSKAFWQMVNIQVARVFSTHTVFPGRFS